jgi:hypothetical protein
MRRGLRRHEADLEADHYIQVSDPQRVVAAVEWVVGEASRR